MAKSEITNWWWFNESLGRTASDSVGNNDGTLLGGMKWGADAVEGTSVQFEKPGQMMDLGLVDNSFNSGRFQLSFWFKRKEEGFSWSTEQVSNVMKSLGDENGSTLQLEQKARVWNFLWPRLFVVKSFSWIWNNDRKMASSFGIV